MLGKSDRRRQREDEYAKWCAEDADYMLIQQTIRKLGRGKIPEIIADELEKIHDICKEAARFASDYDADAIMAVMQR